MIIISIIGFILFPFLSIPLILIGIGLDGKKHPLLYSILLSLPFVIIAYNFVPDYSKDLYRYYYMINEYYGPMGINDFFGVIFQSNKLLFELLCYIISQIENFRLLPLICTFAGYSIAFYMILDFAKTKEISNIKTLFIIIAYICIYYHINFISGLAQFLAINIAALAFYLEYIKKKKGIIYKMLYVVSIFIHMSLLLVLIIRILLNFNYNKVKKIMIPILLIYAINPVIVLKFLSMFQGNLLLSSLLSKTNMYLIECLHIWDSTYGIALLLLQIFFIIVFYISIKEVRKNLNEKICNFIEIVLLFTVSSSLYSDIFIRFSNLVLLFMSIYILMVLNMNKKINNFFIIISVIVFSVLMGSVNLNNFKSSEFNNIFSNMTENVIYYFERVK